MINIARLCFGLNMFTTSPLEAFVCREVSFNPCPSPRAEHESDDIVLSGHRDSLLPGSTVQLSPACRRYDRADFLNNAG